MKTVPIPLSAWGMPSEIGGNPPPVVYTRYAGWDSPAMMAMGENNIGVGVLQLYQL